MKRLGEILTVVVLLVGLSFAFFSDSSKSEVRYNVLIEAKTISPFGYVWGMGSGVVIDEDGTVITAKHVINTAVAVRVTLADGRVFDVNDVNDIHVDGELDVGFIDLPGKFSEYVKLSDKDIDEGDRIYCVGNPHGLFVGRVNFGKTVNPVFSRMCLGSAARHILSDLDVAPGNSGGGLYHDSFLIGVVIIKVEEYTIAISGEACIEALKRYATATGKE